MKTTITIHPNDNNGFNFNYQTNKFGTEIELEGNLIPYNTGRCTEYKIDFETFENQETENTMSNNYETIEDDILNHLNNNWKKINK